MSTMRDRMTRFGGVALLVAVLLDVSATAALARAMGTANDLFPRWYGTRAWLFSGLDPYSTEVSEGIRQAMGGAPGESRGAFVFGFVYPGYVALLLAPLAWLPFQWAATLWLLLAQGATGAGAWLCWRATKRERPAAFPVQERWVPGSVASSRIILWGRGPSLAGGARALLVAFLFPASLINLTFGQFAAVVFWCLAGAWYLLVRCNHATHVRMARRGLTGSGGAGALLALALVKPSLGLFPVAALLLWALGQRRYGAIASFLLCCGGLAGLSLVAVPEWPVAFWRSTADYARVASATSASGLVALVLARPLGAASGAIVPALTGAVATAATLAAGVGWWVSPRRAGDALATGVVLGAWLVSPLYEWNSILLLIPLLIWLRRRTATPIATIALVMVSMLTLPLIARWPSESRALWPSIVLAGWATQGTARAGGTRNVVPRRAGGTQAV